MKIVINKCYGGFSISRECAELMAKLGNKQAEEELKEDEFYGGNYPRDCKELIEAVEQLGEKANGEMAKLKIVEIPDGVIWEINETVGKEWIAECHRKWG